MNNSDINKKVLNFTIATIQSYLDLTDSADIVFNSFILSMDGMNTDSKLDEIEFIYDSIGFHDLEGKTTVNKLLSIHNGLKINDNGQIDRLSMLINRW